VSYAEGTSVPVERSKAELEKVVRQHGGYNYGTGSRDDAGVALVYFTIGVNERRRQVRLLLPLPKLASGAEEEQHFARRRGQRRGPRELWEQACRERWRVLVLAVRAKFELVEAGGSTIEREFLADLALPDGRTVGELLPAVIAEAYLTGQMPALGRSAPGVVVEGELEEPPGGGRPRR
jgi:hypothetical protein